jgi:hypothetical protein
MPERISKGINEKIFALFYRLLKALKLQGQDNAHDVDQEATESLTGVSMGMFVGHQRGSELNLLLPSKTIQNKQ